MGVAASVEKGIIGRAAPYLKQAGLFAEHGLESVAGAVQRGLGNGDIGKAAGKVVSGAPSMVGSAIGTGARVGFGLAEKGAGLIAGYGSKLAMAYAGYDMAREFVERAVFGSEQVKAQEAADGVSSGYVRGLGILGGAVGTMWLGRKVAAGGLRTVASGVANKLKDPESALSKSVKVVDVAGGKVFGFAEEKAANVAGKAASKMSGLAAEGAADGDVFGAKVAGAGARAFSGAEGLFRSGGTAGMAARAEDLAARRAAREAGLATAKAAGKDTAGVSKGLQEYSAGVKKDEPAMSRAADFIIDGGGTTYKNAPGMGPKIPGRSVATVESAEIGPKKIDLEFPKQPSGLNKMVAGAVLAGGGYMAYEHMKNHEIDPRLADQQKDPVQSFGKDKSFLSRGPAGNIENLAPGHGGGQEAGVASVTSRMQSGLDGVQGGGSVGSLLSEGHLRPSTAMKLASVDNRMAMAARAMNFGDVTNSKAHTGFDVSEGSTSDGGRFFRVMRTGQDDLGANREFALAVGANGKGGMSETELKKIGSNSVLSKTVIANEPGVVNGKINDLTGQMVPEFGPKAAPISSALGVLSRQSDNLSALYESAATHNRGMTGALRQTTGPEANQVLEFSVKKGNEVQNGRVELSNGYGRMVMLSPDGKEEAWAKQVPGISVGMDTTGNARLNGNVDKMIGSFIKDPEGYARSVGVSHDPGIGMPALAEGAMQHTKDFEKQQAVSQDLGQGKPGMGRSPDFVSDTAGAPAGGAAGIQSKPEVSFRAGAAEMSPSRSPAVEMDGANTSVLDRSVQKLKAQSYGVGSTVGSMIDMYAQGSRILSSSVGADEAGPLGMRGRREDTVFVGENGSRMEFGTFTGKDAKGNEGAFSGMMSYNGNGQSLQFQGTSEFSKDGVQVSRSVNAVGSTIGGVDPQGLAAKVMAGSVRVLSGRDDNLAEVMSQGALKNPKLSVEDSLETDRGGVLKTDQRIANFSGLDENNKMVRGSVMENKVGTRVTLFGPDGKTPEFSLTVPSGDKEEAKSAIRDFIQDPKGFEREHNAESVLGRPNAAMGGVGTSDPTVAQAVRANSVFKASPALANWADMGAERYSPARGGNPEPVVTKSREAAHDGGMGF